MPRQRDIFPLPPFEETVLNKHTTLCRSVQRRLLRRGYRGKWMNQALDTLDGFAGPRVLDPGSASPPCLGTRKALDHVASCFSNISQGDDSVLSDGALE